jgi:predicted RND superfamily exporter protein
VGTGVIMSLIAMTTVLPAMLVLIDQKFKWIRMKHVWGHNWGGRRGQFPYAKTVLLVAFVITGYLGYHLPDIQFEYDFTNLRANLPASAAVKQKMATISKYNKESQSYSIVLADNREDLDEIVEAIEKKIATDDPTPTIDKVKTLWTELRGQDRKLEIVEELRTIAYGEGVKLLKGPQKEKLDSLRTLLDVKKLAVSDLPENILRRFRTIDGSQAYFAQILPSVQLRDGKNAMAFAEDAHQIETASGKVFHSSGSEIIFADMLTLMLRDSPIAITLVMVLVIVLVDFRSFRATLLVMFPLLCGAVWMCGTLYLQNAKLNFYNIVALPTIIGMGIDNGVHLYHRYREEGPGSMPQVLKSTGGAMLLSMLTTMVGFFGLVTATHPGLNSIGQLAIIGLFTCFITAVLVLPALLEVIEGHKAPAVKDERAEESPKGA